MDAVGCENQCYVVADDIDALADVMGVINQCFMGTFGDGIADPGQATALARLGNDGMADYVARYPDRFPSFIASLPLNNMDATMEELHRCMKDLKVVAELPLRRC